jgi:hypothetical protein
VFLLVLASCAGIEAQEKPRLVHVFVALADNEHQGIVPVPKNLGNGNDPESNLYWGAAFGVRTYFKKSSEWREISTATNPTPSVLERSLFVHRASGTYLLADGYRGSEIRAAIEDFFSTAAGQELKISGLAGHDGSDSPLPQASLVVYVGHDGLMDFQLDKVFQEQNGRKRDAMVLACASKPYFAAALRQTGAQPLLWTTRLMAPEAYTLKAALDGWIAGESPDKVRRNAANAYAKYQKISVSAAERLFASGW